MIKFVFFLLSPFAFVCIMNANGNQNILVVGSSLDLSRGIWTEGRAAQEGINAVFDGAKIPGIQLKFDARDDQYMAETALANVESFIKQHIDILLMPMGSATFRSYFDLVKEGKILALFPSPGIPDIHDPSVRYCMYLRPSYYDQAAVLAHYVLSKEVPRLHKIVLFYQDDAFGKACVSGAKSVFDHAGIKTMDVFYERNNMNLSGAAAHIKSASADAIGLFCTALAAKGLLEALGDSVVSHLKLFAIDDVGQAPMKKYMKDKGVSVIISSVVPNPETSEIELIKEYRSHIKEVDTYSLEAFIGASIFVDILSHLQLPITKEKIIDSCESIKNYKLKGFPLNYNPQKRQLSNSIWINNGSSEWKQIESR